MLTIICCGTIVVIGQEKTLKWGTSVSIGLNTTSTKSTYVSPVDYNWSVGVIRYLKKKSRLQHSLHLKLNTFNETLKKLPYYKLDQNGILNESTYSSKGIYRMIYLGWNLQMDLQSKPIFLHGGLGFNYMLPAKYKNKFASGTGVQTYGRPFNLVITRPEISLGVGFKKNLGTSQLVVKTIYSYNFTFGYLNLVPSFHSFGIETIFNF